MNTKRSAELDLKLNEAQQAANDVAGTLELLSIVYGTLAVKHPKGSEESMLASTFSTIQTQAAKVSKLLEEALE